MADPHTPPQNPGFSNPNPAYHTEKTTTHIREARVSTNWLAYLLGAAVVVLIIAAFVFSGRDAPATQPAGGNNVTIESPATAPAPAPDAIPAPDAAAPAPAPDAPAATTPDATAPVAPAPEANPDAGTAAPPPAGN